MNSKVLYNDCVPTLILLKPKLVLCFYQVKLHFFPQIKGVDDLPKVTVVKRISAYIWHNNHCQYIYKNKGYKFQIGHEYRCVSIQGGNQLTQVDSTMDFKKIFKLKYFVQYIIT